MPSAACPAARQPQGRDSLGAPAAHAAATSTALLATPLAALPPKSAAPLTRVCASPTRVQKSETVVSVSCRLLARPHADTPMAAWRRRSSRVAGGCAQCGNNATGWQACGRDPAGGGACHARLPAAAARHSKHLPPGPLPRTRQAHARKCGPQQRAAGEPGAAAAGLGGGRSGGGLSAVGQGRLYTEGSRGKAVHCCKWAVDERQPCSHAPSALAVAPPKPRPIAPLSSSRHPPCRPPPRPPK